MISEMVSPKSSHHLLLLWREDGCAAGRPTGAQLAAGPAGWLLRQREQGGSLSLAAQEIFY